MGSKTPPPSQPAQDDPSAEDVPSRPAPSDGPAASRLLRRIAHALLVPPSALYNPPNAVSAVALSETATVAVDNDIEIECEALLHAYKRIHDPEMRRRLLTLIQAAVKRT